MHRIDTIDAVPQLPDPGPPGVPGYYSDGDINTGRRGTVMSAAALNAVQEEICNVVEHAGIALDKSNNAQLLQAIRSMIEGTLAAAEDSRIGEVFWWPFDTEPEGRAMRCVGQAVPRTGATAKLFAKAGTKYGAGDGVSTFNLPDPRKYFLRVWDDREQRPLGSTQADQNKSHGHTGGIGQAGARGATETGDAGEHAHDYQRPPPATSPDGQGADAGQSYLDITKYETVPTSSVPPHRHAIPAVPAHDHPLTIDPSGGDEARPMNMAWALYIRY